DLCFEVRIGHRTCAPESLCGQLKRFPAELTERRVDLLVGIGELAESRLRRRPQRRWQRAVLDYLEQGPAVVAVVVGESDEGQHRRPDVGMIREDCAGLAQLTDSRANHAQPCVGDVVLNVAMVPGEASSNRNTRWWRAAGRCEA